MATTQAALPRYASVASSRLLSVGRRQIETDRIWLPITMASGILGLVLRIGIVTSRDIWTDEAFTWEVTSADFSPMWHRLVTDYHPPLHYLLLWLIQQQTPDTWTPTFLRMVNLSWFIGLGILTAWAAKQPHLRAGLVPAFCVVALAPGFVQLGSELRMYGMVLTCVAILLVAVTQIVERPAWAAIVVASAAAAAAVWTHYAGVVAAGAIIGAAVIRGGRRRIRAMAPVMIIFTVSVGLLVPYALRQFGHGIGYQIGLDRVAKSVGTNLSLVGVALLCVSLVCLVIVGVGRRRGIRPAEGPTEIASIALLSVAFFTLGVLAWYVVKGQNPVNEGVSTVPTYLLLVGVLGLRIVPLRTLVVTLLIGGLVTAGYSMSQLWGAPNYQLGKRVSDVDVLDKAIRDNPGLSRNGGQGWLIVGVDWADMNEYFSSEAAKRLPQATIATDTPSRDGGAAELDGGRGKYRQILLIRRPGNTRVGDLAGYRRDVQDRWTSLYTEQN